MSALSDHRHTASTSSARRKSFGFFSRPTVLAEADWMAQNESPIKPSRPKSLFGVSLVDEIAATPTPRPQGKLTKPPRPRSVFGSFKSRESLPQPDSPRGIGSSASSSMESSNYDTPSSSPATISATVVLSGELVTGGGLLRKKKEYVVLTNRELLRYKSEAKFVEAFGCLPMPIRTHGRRGSSAASFAEITGDHTLITRLDQIVAVFFAGSEAESGSSIQVDYIDTTGSPCSIVFQASTPFLAQGWVDKIRNTAFHARQEPESPSSWTESAIEYVIQRVESERDYSPNRFLMYRIVQRAGQPGKKSGSSVEDLQKMYCTTAFLAIGLHKIHIIPMKLPHKNGGTGAPSMAATSHALLNISAMSISEYDDSFSLTFRLPCRTPQKLLLASAHSADIIQSLRQLHEYYLPLWKYPPYTLNIPDSMKLIDESLPEIPPTPGDDLGGFDRTMAAFGTAYDLDVSNILYAVYYDVEDGPQFVLYPPSNSRRRQYSDLELLAVLRTLRWNQNFGSISFRGISLDNLNNVIDRDGSEYEPRIEQLAKSKVLMESKNSLLVHELRALAYHNVKLRRVDFSECFKPRKRERTTVAVDEFTSSTSNEKACPALEAIMPLCRRGLTDLDWFVMTGVELLEPDLDWLIDAAASRLAHFRGFELARCGLTERMITLFLNALTTHENTLEALDFSGNPARLDSSSFNNAMSYFPLIRKLSVSRILRTVPHEAALLPETLLTWRLEELDLSEISLNAESVDSIAIYLSSEKSGSLRHLDLSQCGITAADVSVLMRAMNHTPGKARPLHLHIGQNPLAKDRELAPLIDCIRDGITPSHLTMRMVDYPKEELFQEVVRAFAVNKTIVFLDISKTSLPYEAGDKTCEELGKMFAKNTTLRELNISGEQAVLECARLGPRLCQSFSGLAENKTLQVLRIELQALGTRGAMELASLLAKNHTLKELHCEQNEVHLQGFTAMVNALETNHSLTVLSPMDKDRVEHLRVLKEKLFQSGLTATTTVSLNGMHYIHGDASKEKEHEGGGKIRGALMKRAHRSLEKKVGFKDTSSSGTPGREENLVGVEQSLQLLDQKWESEKERMHRFLGRNAAELAVGSGPVWGAERERDRDAMGQEKPPQSLFVLPEITRVSS